MKLLSARKLWFSFSSLLIIASITAIAVWGLRIGIDFSGGQLLEARFSAPTTANQVREILTPNDDESLPNISVAETAPNTFLLRFSADDSELELIRTKLGEIAAATNTEVGPPAGEVGEGENEADAVSWEEIRFESVGPTVGRDLTERAVIGVILASIAIILYIAWAFRRVPPPTNSWQFGITAIIALLHDLIITIGVFAALGQYFGFEVDSLFITALLTVMGFSVHDTIVTYDRIRENLLANVGSSFSDMVNQSVKQTVVRSLNTSLTLIIVLVTLLVLGGITIRPFISALLVGVAIGTYSSIFIAAQLLIVWQERSQVRQNRD